VTADSCLRHKLVQLLCFGRAAGTLAFAGEDRNVDELPVPVAPTGALARWRSTADGAMQVIRDDVAALAPSQLEQFGPVAWIRFIGGLCQVRAGQCKAPRFSSFADQQVNPC
jgi:hypothetical protein